MLLNEALSLLWFHRLGETQKSRGGGGGGGQGLAGMTAFMPDFCAPFWPSTLAKRIRVFIYVVLRKERLSVQRLSFDIKTDYFRSGRSTLDLPGAAVITE